MWAQEVPWSKMARLSWRRRQSRQSGRANPRHRTWVDIRMLYRFAATIPDSWTPNMVAFEFSESSSDRCSFICFKVNWPNSQQQLGFGPKYLSILACAPLLPVVPTTTLHQSSKCQHTPAPWSAARRRGTGGWPGSAWWKRRAAVSALSRE